MLANHSEVNFWNERRESIQKSENPSSNPFQLASLPSASLPALSPTNFSKQFTFPKSFLRTHKQIPKNLPPVEVKRISSILNFLPATYGSVRKISLPRRAKSETIIIHIQDVHLNSEAQTNIGAAIQKLIDNNVVDLIGLEGAFSSINLDGFRNFPDKDILRKVADYLLRENQISGPMHTALTSSKNIPPIVGVDDFTHYQLNVESYKQSAPSVEENKRKLLALEKQLAESKRKVFNASLLAFDEQAEAYQDARVPLGEYMRSLADRFDEISPDVKLFLDALRAESQLDLNWVETERNQVIAKLIKELDKTQTQELVNMSVAYRLGEVSHMDFYRYVRDLCEKNNLKLAHYPAMDAYISYLLLSEMIDTEKVFGEMRRMENNVYTSLTKNQDEERLVSELKLLRLTKKLLDFSLTPEEWAEYKELTSSQSIPPVPIHLESFEAFYKEAELRDKALIENLLKAAKNEKGSTSVLVTGGFHSRGIDELARDAGFTVITYVPKITKVDSKNGPSYLSIFAQEKAPIEKLFEGEKLFLSPLQTKSLTEGGLIAASLTTNPQEALRQIFTRTNMRVEKQGSSKGVVAVTWRNVKTGVVQTVRILLTPKEITEVIFSIPASITTLVSTVRNRVALIVDWVHYEMPDWLYALTIAGLIEKWDIYRKDFAATHSIEVLSRKHHLSPELVMKQLYQNQIAINVLNTFGFIFLSVILSERLNPFIAIGVGLITTQFILNPIINHNIVVNGFRLATGGVPAAKRKKKKKTANDPPWWNSAWPIPVKEELDHANSTLAYFVNEAKEDSFIDGVKFLIMDDEAGYGHQEKGRTLRAIYYLNQDVGSALLMSFSYGLHGDLRKILFDPWETMGPDGIDRTKLHAGCLLEPEMIGAMVNRGYSLIHDYQNPMHNEMELSFNWGLDGIAGVMGYLPQELSQEILQALDDNALPKILSEMANIVQHHSGGYPATRQAILDLLLKIPQDQWIRLWTTLPREMRSYLNSLGIASPPVPQQSHPVPDHWNSSWPIPSDPELSRARNTVEHRIDMLRDDYSSQRAGSSFAVNHYEAGPTHEDQARTLRAIYYLYPDLAAALIMSFDTGLHGEWAAILDSDYVEVEILGKILDRGLRLYKEERRPEFNGKVFEDYFRLDGVSGVLGYLPHDTAVGMLQDVGDDVLNIIVRELVDYVRHERGVYPEVRRRTLNVLESIPKERYQRVQKTFTPETRDYLLDIGAAALPEILPPPRVDKSIPRVIGKAVGTLVIVKGETPDFGELTRVPKNSIVAMEFLPSSDLRIGPFRGIITFRQEGETSHAQTRSRLWGIPHALIPGPDSLASLEGKVVELEVARDKVDVHEVGPQVQMTEDPASTEEEIIRIILPEVEADDKTVFLAPGDPRLKKPEFVGHKVAQLNQLAGHTFSLTDSRIHLEFATGAAFPFGAFGYIVRSEEDGELRHLISALNSESTQQPDNYRIQSLSKRIQRALEGVLAHTHRDFPEIWNQMYPAGAFLWKGAFVRASTNAEDLPGHPGLGAGIYMTVQNVRGEHPFFNAVEDVYASVWSEGAFWERQKFGVQQNTIYPAIWLVPSVEADYAFVIHTSAVSIQDPNLLVIEIVQGLGESLVGNDPKFAGFPSRIVWDKSSRRIIEKTPSTKRFRSVLAEAGGTVAELSDPSAEFVNNPDMERLVLALAEAGEQSEVFFKGQPQDIEGALKKDSNDNWTITLLQTRAIGNADSSLNDQGERSKKVDLKRLLNHLASIRHLRARHPEGAGGTHFTTYLYPEIPLVEKIPHSEHVIDSIRLGKENLGGLTVGFAYIEDNGTGHLIMNSVPSLKTVLEQKIKAGLLIEAEALLRKFFAVNLKIIKRGVVNWDPKIENYGVDAEGEVVLLDVGGLVAAREVLDADETDDSDIFYFFSKMTEGIPSELSSLFNQLRDEFGFGHGGEIFQTIKENFNTEPGKPVEWIPDLSAIESSSVKDALPSLLGGYLAVVSNFWGEFGHYVAVRHSGRKATIRWGRDSVDGRPHVEVENLPTEGWTAFILAAVHPLINLFWAAVPAVWWAVAGLPQGPPILDVIFVLVIVHGLLNLYGFVGNLFLSFFSIQWLPIPAFNFALAGAGSLQYSSGHLPWLRKANNPNSDWNRMLYALTPIRKFFANIVHKPASNQLLSELADDTDTPDILLPTGLLAHTILGVTKEDIFNIKTKGLLPASETGRKNYNRDQAYISLSLGEDWSGKHAWEKYRLYEDWHKGDSIYLVVDPEYVRRNPEKFDLSGVDIFHHPELFIQGLTALGLLSNRRHGRPGDGKTEIYVGQLPSSAIKAVIVRPENLNFFLRLEKLAVAKGLPHWPVYVFGQHTEDPKIIYPQLLPQPLLVPVTIDSPFEHEYEKVAKLLLRDLNSRIGYDAIDEMARGQGAPLDTAVRSYLQGVIVLAFWMGWETHHLGFMAWHDNFRLAKTFMNIMAGANPYDSEPRTGDMAVRTFHRLKQSHNFDAAAWEALEAYFPKIKEIYDDFELERELAVKAAVAARPKFKIIQIRQQPPGEESKPTSREPASAAGVRDEVNLIGNFLDFMSQSGRNKELSFGRDLEGAQVMILGPGAGHDVIRFLERYPNIKAIHLVDKSVGNLTRTESELARYIELKGKINTNIYGYVCNEQKLPETLARKMDVVLESSGYFSKPQFKQANNEVMFMLRLGGVHLKAGAGSVEHFEPADEMQEVWPIDNPTLRIKKFPPMVGSPETDGKLLPTGLLIHGVLGNEQVLSKRFFAIKEVGLISRSKSGESNEGSASAFEDQVSFALTREGSFSNSATLEYGPLKRYQKGIGIILDPAYVRRHTDDFQLVGKRLNQTDYLRSMWKLGFEAPVRDVGYLFWSGGPGPIPVQPFDDEIHAEAVPPEGVLGVIVHASQVEKVREWEVQARQRGFRPWKVYVIDDDGIRESLTAVEIDSGASAASLERTNSPATKTVDLDSSLTENTFTILNRNGESFDEARDRLKKENHLPDLDDPRVWPVEVEHSSVLSTMNVEQLGQVFRELISGQHPIIESIGHLATQFPRNVDLVRAFIDTLSIGPSATVEMAHHFRHALNRPRLAKEILELEQELGQVEKEVEERLQRSISNALRYRAFIRELIHRWRKDIGSGTDGNNGGFDNLESEETKLATGLKEDDETTKGDQELSQKLDQAAAALASIFLLASNSKTSNVDQVVEEFFKNAPISVGVGSIAPASGQSIISQDERDWAKVVQDPHFPEVFYSEIAKLNAKKAQDVKGDIVVEINEPNDLVKARGFIRKNNLIQSVTLLAANNAEKEKIVLQLADWNVAVPVEVYVRDSNLFIDRRMVLSRLRSSVPSRLRPNLPNILFVSFQRVEIDASGIGVNSDLNWLKIMILDQVGSAMMMTVRDHLALDVITKALIFGRQA